MREDVLEVDTGVLRDCAAELTGTAYRLGHGLPGAAGLSVTAPEWTAAEALAVLESAVHGYLTAVGAQAGQTAVGLRAAAEAYEAVDDRAVRRLAQVR